MVDQQVVALQQLHVGRNDVTYFQFGDIARHQLARRQDRELAIAQHDDLDGQTLLEGLEGIQCTVFLEEIQRRIDQQQDGDDGEVFPLLHDGGQQRRHLDHPRDRPPETTQDAVPEGLFAFFDFVVSVLRQARPGLGRRKATIGIYLQLA